jgi:hypothetical protein
VLQASRLPDGALDPALLAEVLRHALDGVAVLDSVAGRPRIVYANATLAGLLHRPEEWPTGRSLDDIEMEAPVDPNRTSVGVGQRVQLRRADGTTVECERWAMLLPDAPNDPVRVPASRFNVRERLLPLRAASLEAP